VNRQQIRARVRDNADWYRITNAAGEAGSAATVVIYDEIGFWGVSAAQFMDELRAITAPAIDLRLNSPGGDVFDGIAIHNVLRSHSARVTTYVDSLAASIASVIALAGDTIVMQPHSQLMIHESSGLTIGAAADMREMADLLDRQSDNIAGIYAERAGGDVVAWREAMRAETWYTAQEAVDAGLADRVAERPRQTDDGVPENRWDLSIFNYAGREHAPPPVAPSLLDDTAESVEGPAVVSRSRIGWLYA
jgi:ATP-dependent protease ClpP protease subunit